MKIGVKKRMSYKKWKEKWRLHSKGYDKAFSWIPPTIKVNKKYVLIGIFLVLALLFGDSKASYTFPYSDDKVTMDVDKVNGGGGTWRCPSVQACYIKVLEAEARGANYYCNSIVIKRNGKVIWWRKYR